MTRLRLAVSKSRRISSTLVSTLLRRVSMPELPLRRRMVLESQDMMDSVLLNSSHSGWMTSRSLLSSMRMVSSLRTREGAWVRMRSWVSSSKGARPTSREKKWHIVSYMIDGQGGESEVFIMSRPHRNQDAPLPRSQPHFRIHSAGKRGLREPLTCLGKRKGSLEEREQSHERLNAEKARSGGKVKLPREVLKHKMDKPGQVQYVQVRTEQDREDSSRKRSADRAATPRVLKFCRVDPPKDPREQPNDAKIKQPTEQTHKREKEGKEKEGKGKYRCRVNQHIFGHTRRKSNLREGEDHAHFWQQVNESLILPVHPEAPSSELATLAHLLEGLPQ